MENVTNKREPYFPEEFKDDYKEFEFRDLTLQSKKFKSFITVLEKDVTCKDTTVSYLKLRVNPGGAMSFRTSYRVKVGQYQGTLRHVSLGRYPLVSIVDARAKAKEIREAVDAGGDPVREKKKSQEAIALKLDNLDNSYETMVEQFITKWCIQKKKNRTWKETKRILLRAGKQWLKWPLPDVSENHVQDALDSLIDENKPYMANRTWQAFNVFFKWAKRRKKITSNPMADIEKPFDNEEPTKRPWNNGEIKKIWSSAESIGGMYGDFIKLLMIMGQRVMEVAAMDGDEVNFENATWILPRERSKNKRDHTFPLPQLAIDILANRELEEDNQHFFPGPGKLGHFIPGSKLKNLVATKSGVTDFTFKQARDTLRTELDKLKIPDHIKIACLNHTPQDVGSKSYSSYDYLAEQREAFDAWAKVINDIVSRPSNVVAMEA
ncbi:MAG: site-specific integrase [Gammaproteobacteria bacterium]|nr:site-specific integrase [Gammaproteobacteria bacterium]MDH5800002.1 site-specific integrase [Gammaproteobacteria bacterium]